MHRSGSGLSPRWVSTLLPGAPANDGWPRRRTEGLTVVDHLDVPLEDAVLLEEVELISTLMIAASENDAHLDQEQIDALLGLSGAVLPEQQDGRSA